MSLSLVGEKKCRLLLYYPETNVREVETKAHQAPFKRELILNLRSDETVWEES